MIDDLVAHWNYSKAPLSGEWVCMTLRFSFVFRQPIPVETGRLQGRILQSQVRPGQPVSLID